MAFLIGNARIDENGSAHGGAAGDQNGKEVQTQSWYSYPWNCVVRAKDSTVAEKIAQAMEYACSNNNIGYDQYQRTTLYAKMAALGWYPGNLAKVGKCETDCSALVAVCVTAAGVPVSQNMWTGNEADLLVATGKFEKLTAVKYTSGYSYLKRGDILINTVHHTAIALSTGANAGTTAATTSTASQTSTDTYDKERLQMARCFDKTIAGTYTVTAGALYMRYGADKDKYPAITILPNGAKAVCYGYYNIAADGTKWLLVVYKGYTGYCSLKYMKK